MILKLVSITIFRNSFRKTPYRRSSDAPIMWKNICTRNYLQRKKIFGLEIVFLLLFLKDTPQPPFPHCCQNNSVVSKMADEKNKKKLTNPNY